jgi:predicted nucleic acid-binding protein
VPVRWVLDTNCYVRASQNREARRTLNAFHDRHFGRTDLAATVWLELQAGVRDGATQVELDELAETFASRDAILTPSAQAFQQAGRSLAGLAIAEGLDLNGIRPSFHHDVMLACTVREYDRTLVTYNADDFTRIQRHLRGFRFVAPYPG